MRSVHGPVFNHDDGANGYDADVRNEKDPIRAAYHDVLAWVISEARIDSFSRVLELGSGTGNLSCLLDRCGELVCVDLSERMEAIARSKSGHILNRRFFKADILEVFDYERAPFDSVISTYAIHHLTDEEKRLLFGKVFAGLFRVDSPVFGHLIFRTNPEKAQNVREDFPN